MKSLGDVEVEGFVLRIRDYHGRSVRNEFIAYKEIYS